MWSLRKLPIHPRIHEVQSLLLHYRSARVTRHYVALTFYSEKACLYHLPDHRNSLQSYLRDLKSNFRVIYSTSWIKYALCFKSGPPSRKMNEVNELVLPSHILSLALLRRCILELGYEEPFESKCRRQWSPLSWGFNISLVGNFCPEHQFIPVMTVHYRTGEEP